MNMEKKCRNDGHGETRVTRVRVTFRTSIGQRVTADMFLTLSLICTVALCSLLAHAGAVAGQSSNSSNSSNSNSSNNVARRNPGSWKVSDVCPGLERVLNQNGTVLQGNATLCEGTARWFTAHQGAVYALCGPSESVCYLHIEVPKGMLARTHVRREAYWCGSSPWSSLLYCADAPESYLMWWVWCGYHTLRDFFIQSEQNHVFILSKNEPALTFHVEAIASRDLVLRFVSETSGYVTVPYASISYNKPLKKELEAPHHGYTIMISFQASYLCDEAVATTKVVYRNPSTNRSCVDSVCKVPFLTARHFLTSHLQIETHDQSHNLHSSVQLYFSFHSEDKQPPKAPGHRFNCSTNHYFDFQKHLDCNLKVECSDGRDETEHCSFSNAACAGLVASRNKCYKLVFLERAIYFSITVYECQKTGGQLASIKTRKEQGDVLKIYQNYSNFAVFVGFLSGWYSVPFLYSKFPSWSDKTMIYNLSHFHSHSFDIVYSPSRTVKTAILMSMNLKRHKSIKKSSQKSVLCEIKFSSENIISTQPLSCHSCFSMLIFRNSPQLLSVDTRGQVFHSFMLPDARSLCDNATTTTTTTLYVCQPQASGQENKTIRIHYREGLLKENAMFVCDDTHAKVHYTLVCDFRADCADDSDETFCSFPPCSDFQCSNGQCILFSLRCNQHSDCIDDSDEVDCPEDETYHSRLRMEDKQQSFLINLDGTGYFTLQAMTGAESCPDTHYRCKDQGLSCFPAYTRCNGLSDCVYGEDELNCKSVMCPGFYRCRSSKVCVHGDHLCDGWGQCPERDDELFCDLTCPDQCLCQGYFFLCWNSFIPEPFPHLRRVDATGTDMTVADFSHKTYLIHLSLTYCHLVNISYVYLPSLLHIDVEGNEIRIVDMSVFLHLHSLRFLNLAKNPLSTMVRDSSKRIHYELREVDLSNTNLQILTILISTYLPQLRTLNISFVSAKEIPPSGFKNMPQLIEVDIRGSPIRDFPMQIFSGLKHLKAIFTSNYRLCCKQVLPMRSNNLKCSSPSPALCSCESMIPTQLHRLFFWFTCLSALLGSLVCFTAPFRAHKVVGKSLGGFIIQLQVANICMGFHVGIVSTASELIREDYLQLERAWTNSAACKLAALLSLLSSEVSVIIFSFVTLNLFIAVCFSGKFCKFKDNSITIIIIVSVPIWILALVLSSIPLFPWLSHWGLQDQSGLCRLALFDHYSLDQRTRWFSVTATLNCILSLVTVTGQAAIHRRAPKQRIALDPSARLLYSATNLLENMSVTSVACWLAFGVATLMGTQAAAAAVSRAAHGTLVVFVLPLHSALSPWLYVWKVTSQRREQAQERKLLDVLKARMWATRKQ